MSKIAKITKIDWDVDRKADLKHLPKVMLVTIPEDITEDEDEISDYLSDEISNITGFCHKKFDYSIEK